MSEILLKVAQKPGRSTAQMLLDARKNARLTQAASE